MDRARIVELAGGILSDPSRREQMSRVVNPYGDGQAARRIRDAILYHFDRRPDRPDEFGGVSDA
jgi:UDP-N-acetylglucosamine 2-epimerase (non-hydrolysing)